MKIETPKRIADFFKRNHIKPLKPYAWGDGETLYCGFKDDDIIAIRVAENYIVVYFDDYERIKEKYKPIVEAEFGKTYETHRCGYCKLFIKEKL